MTKIVSSFPIPPSLTVDSDIFGPDANWQMMDEPDYDNHLGTGFAVFTGHAEQAAAALHQVTHIPSDGRNRRAADR